MNGQTGGATSPLPLPFDPTHDSPLTTSDWILWGQVCIASMGKVKKLCMDVISSENTFIAVVFYRALRFEGI